MRQEAAHHGKPGNNVAREAVGAWMTRGVGTYEASGEEASAHTVYRALLMNPGSSYALDLSRRFLRSQLALVSNGTDELPRAPEAWDDWIDQSAHQVTESYKLYLKERKAGAPRRFFATRGQALSFLVKVAPTKLVDGAWLYGVLEHWKDVRLQPLVETFLEELGRGDPDQNHVLLYKKLMVAEGCDPMELLDVSYYVQGAIQLSLGYHANEFLPELIGYNLGYEQLPLHLLITSYELNELGIDPYYFTLHVTIDNASTGHARRAVQAVMDCLPAEEHERKVFLQRLRRGYALNDLGIGSMAILDSLDVEQDVVDILKRKSQYGLVHSDYCRIRGRTVNEWLTDSDRIPEFLQALIAEGWIKRHRDPSESRFWQLLQGPKAKMFGVFNGWEMAMIHEWIAGDWHRVKARKHRVVRERDGAVEKNAEGVPPVRGSSDALNSLKVHWDGSDSWEHRVRLQDASATMATTETVRNLIRLMAPGKHHTPEGLRATRLFGSLFSNG